MRVEVGKHDAVEEGRNGKQDGKDEQAAVNIGRIDATTFPFLAFISGSRIVKKQRATQGVDARLLSIHI